MGDTEVRKASGVKTNGKYGIGTNRRVSVSRRDLGLYRAKGRKQSGRNESLRIKGDKMVKATKRNDRDRCKGKHGGNQPSKLESW